MSNAVANTMNGRGSGSDAASAVPRIFRHLDVEEQQIGPRVANHLARFDGAAGFADDEHVADRVEQLPHPHARRRLIVDEHGANHAAILTLRSLTCGMRSRATVTPRAVIARQAERRALAEVALQPLAHAVQAEAFAVAAQSPSMIQRRDRCCALRASLIRRGPHDHLDAAGPARLRHAVLHRVLEQRLQQHRRDLRGAGDA